MGFDAEAATWDNDRRAKRAEIIAEEILKSLSGKPRWSAMEFGCGTGLVSFYLRHCFERITLVDTSVGMIEALQAKIQATNATNMLALCADIGDSAEIRGEPFDAIYTSMALHHIVDTRATLQRLYELLSVGGSLCIVELMQDGGAFHKSEVDFMGHDGFDPCQLKRVLEDVGLQRVAAHTFYHGVKAIEGSDVGYSLFLIAGEK